MEKRKEPDTEVSDQQPFKRTASMALVVAATAPSNSQIVEHRGGNGLKVCEQMRSRVVDVRCVCIV